ncbi:MAG: peptide chain release factor N(5)-glutamine methyltransferase [Pseudomonadota bacterium]
MPEAVGEQDGGHRPTVEFRRLNVSIAIRRAAGLLCESETPLLDARVLMKHALSCDDAALIADERRLLSDTEAEQFAGLLFRRLNNEPAAYIVGEREFWGMAFKTRAPVLIPRPDTETLVECALSAYGSTPPRRILDLGSGSGAILIALLHEWPTARGVGVDLSPEAISLAAENATRLGVGDRASFVQANWNDVADMKKTGVFDLVVSNPPYISYADMESLPRDVREYEDPRALFADENGVATYREGFNAALSSLSPGGRVIVEIGAGQADSVRRIASETFANCESRVRKDLSGRPRAVRIDMPPAKKPLQCPNGAVSFR